MEKKHQNARFQALVKKMEIVKQEEKGNLKGGFQVISAIKDPKDGSGNNGNFCLC